MKNNCDEETDEIVKFLDAKAKPWDNELAVKIYILAIKCLAQYRDQRPYMQEVTYSFICSVVSSK